MDEVSRETVIQAAQQAAEEAGSDLSRDDFESLTGIGQYHIYKLFPGGWSEVKQLAGLERNPRHQQALSDEDLINEFHKVATALGDIPTWLRFSSHARVSADVVRRRFGGMQGTLKRYRAWLDANHPDSELLQMLNAKSNHEVPTPPNEARQPRGSAITQWAATGGTTYGAPINFRGLRHAPTNEQGVVYLFGIVSYELGIVVESVQSAYPDCEAMRCIDAEKDRWQRVRIEFEYRSSNFRDHKHDPAQCDLIVCWEHNWSGCPLEVLELRSVIDTLGS
jgi:hypothetical protein